MNWVNDSEGTSDDWPYGFTRGLDDDAIFMEDEEVRIMGENGGSSSGKAKKKK